MTAGNFGYTRATDADRDNATSALSGAFADGRLSAEEYEARVGHALSSQTHGQLLALTADLARPAPRTNPLAIASLTCGLAQPVTLMLSTIPAIVLGHVARAQIRRNGEAGAGMALAGLVLGWLAVALAVLTVIGFVLVVAAVVR